MKKHIENLIIGAGISGLATGHFLKKQKKKFYIIESKSNIGGVINTEKINGFICENGPNTVILNNDAIIELIRDLHLSKEIIQPTKYIKNKYFLHKGKIVSIPNSLKSFFTTNLVSMKSKFKFFLRLFFFKKNKYDTVFKYISENFGDDVHDNIIEPFLNGIYAGNTKKMSFKHSLPKLWEIDKKYKGLLDYIINSNKKIKNKNPIYFKEGFKTLIKSLKLRLDNEIYTNTIISKVMNINEKKYLVEFSNGKKITCNKIIFTISPKKIIEVLNLKINFFNKKIYNPIDVVHLAFNKKDCRKNIKGFGILSKKSENKTFLGILLSSDIFPNVAPKESKLITVLVGGEKQSNLCKLDKKKIMNKVECEVKELLEIKNIVFKKHYRWENAIPRYNISNIEFLSSEFYKNLDQHKNIYINGNYINGISVSDCVLKSKKITERI